MPSRKRSENQRKHRSKTFTGCWTCRSRHVKCDERRPTCTRCSKANLQCDGYGVRLTWARVQTSTTSATHGQPPDFRSAIPPVALRSPSPSRDQPLGVPKQSGGWLPQPTTTDTTDATDRVSEFGGPLVSTHSHTVCSGPANFESPSSASDPHVDTLGRRFVQSFRGLDDCVVRQFSSTEQYSSSSSNERFMQTHQDTGDAFDACLIDGRVEDHTSALCETSDERLGDSTTCSDILTQRPVPYYLQTLPNLPLQRELLEHWVTCLVDTILPIPVLNNPLRNVLSPIAMAGAESSAGSSLPEIAVFHLICSASASHLCRLRGESRLVRISLRHHESGMKHLRQCISTADPQQYAPLLAAFCMCLINETLSVGTPFWQVHGRGACTWFSQTDVSYWSKSEAISTIYQLFLGMITMIQLQMASDEQDRLNMPALVFQIPNEFYCMDVLYGLSKSTLSMLFKMIDIERRSTTSSPVTAAELDVLEIQTYLSVPATVENSTNLEERSMIYHHSYLSHYASIIYFKRSLRGTAIADVKSWVTKALEHLEAMLREATRPFSPAVWPVAIVAFETDEQALQLRFQKIFDQLSETLQFEVWPKLKELVGLLWTERRDSHVSGSSDNLAWEFFFRQREGPLMLLA